MKPVMDDWLLLYYHGRNEMSDDDFAKGNYLCILLISLPYDHYSRYNHALLTKSQLDEMIDTIQRNGIYGKGH
jgi:hypothetical protein